MVTPGGRVVASARRVGELVALAVVYVAAARLGFALGPVHTFAAPVWLPTGISLAVVLLGGTGYWPGIALGAFVVNRWVGAPFPVALAMALGNTLEALAGAYLLRRLGGSRRSLDRLRNVLGLAAAAILSTAISATVGASSLLAGGVIHGAALPETWRVWWLGNAVGDLVIASLLLAWSGARPAAGRRELAEAAAIGASIIGAGLLIFAGSPTNAASGFLQACLLIPLLAWGALRFGPRGATATLFLAFVIAVWGTALGRGPFVQDTLSGSLLAMQVFLAIVAFTLLALGAVIAERTDALRSSEEALEEERKACRRAELAEDALREADHRKNEFLGVLSHELRNPLAPIRSAIHLIARTPAGSDGANRAMGVIDRQVTQLTRLVDDLLEVTRIARGKVQLHLSRVELAGLVRQVVEDHRPMFDARGIALAVRADGARWVDADPARLAQIIGNVLHNAAKFTDAGGHVVAQLEQDGPSHAVVRIGDDGVGIAPELLREIFEPFTQADASLHRSGGGLGVGLSLVKRYVDLHGGTVEARSEGLGRGSEFLMRFPAAPEEEPVLRAPPAATVTGRRRVLVVEDNVDAAETLREVLLAGHHEVEVAHDGHEGLEKVRAFRPDVVLCDIGLPLMDGYEVARAIRADEALASTFLVAVTGYALPEDQRRAARAGFDRHLGKPVSMEQIEEVLAIDPRPGRRP